MANEPEQAYLRELLDYDANTGLFTRRKTKFRKAGPCGVSMKKGYIRMRAGSGRFHAHRLAWIWCYGGPIPSDREIDHINGIKTDNRICNLRLVTSVQNRWNRSAYRNNTSGHKGVSLHKASGLWTVHIRANGIRRCLGYYKSKEDAAAAYLNAAQELHGEFAFCK